MRSDQEATGRSSLVDLPPQPAEVPWPTDKWPERDLGDSHVKAKKVAKLVDQTFGHDGQESLGLTRALLIVHQGSIVVERYGPGYSSGLEENAGDPLVPDGPDTRLTSWSMAKSMLHAAIGVVVRTKGLRVERRIPVKEWSDNDDPRHFITWHHLLHMASGLSWIEEYIEDKGSDVISMLFGAGAADMAAFAASYPLSSKPGSQFLYSSGTSNILARALQEELGIAGNESETSLWLQEELFGPLGMTSAEPHFDEAGTWVASSYVDATARDFAKFGLLYLRGGTWDDQMVVERSWVDDARTPISLPTGHACGYGSHWWDHHDGRGTFAAHGYEGQRITCVPTSDLVIVRLGKTAPQPSDLTSDPNPVDIMIDKLIACFD